MCARTTRRKPYCAAAAKVLFAVLVFAFISIPRVAWADGGVNCLGISAYQELDEVSPEPTSDMVGTIFIEFDKNVAFDNSGNGTNSAFIEDNIAKVHLLGPGGAPVEGTEVFADFDRSARRMLFIRCDEWLAPLTTYTVVVDAGVQAANGSDVLAEACEFTFKTSALCENGRTVYENILIPVAPVLVALGIVVQVVRVRRRQR